MARKQSDDSFSEEETARRVEAALRGAFSGPPTPLKDIPKRNGESRLIGNASKGVPAQSKKRKSARSTPLR
jgi:hypothetical protein